MALLSCNTNRRVMLLIFGLEIRSSSNETFYEWQLVVESTDEEWCEKLIRLALDVCSGFQENIRCLVDNSSRAERAVRYTIR